jgi:ABC-type phosphate transport system substrate-binding protein
LKGIILNKKSLILVSCLMVLITLFTALPVFAAGRTITLSGSTTVQPIAEASSTPFYNFTGNNLDVSSGGSGVGETDILANSVDIGMMSSDPSTTAAAQCTDWKIARDMICMVVYKDLDISNITKAEIKTIYEAQAGIATLNWNEVPGGRFTATQLVVPVSREITSGTRDSIKKLVPVDLNKEETTAAQVKTTFTIDRMASNADVAEIVNDPGQFSLGRGLIGYVGLAYANDTTNYPNLKILAVSSDGSTWIMPTSQTFDTYPLKRYLHMLTRLPQYDPTYRLYVLDYIYYMLGSAGQQIVYDAGYLQTNSGAQGTLRPYWDITGDTKICDIFDAVKLGRKWQYVCAYKGEVPEDLNCDAKVDIFDAVALGNNWQKTYQW